MSALFDLKELKKKPIAEQIAIKKKIINENELDYIPPAYLPDVVTEEYYFVSYSHLDYKKVYSDIFDLQQNGLSVWYDRDISLGNNWKDTAYKYMVPYACRGVLFYISENALLSESIRKEIEFAQKYSKHILEICLSSNEKDKTWDLVEKLYKENKIDKDKYDFFMKAFPKENVQIHFLTPCDVRAPKIRDSLPKQNILDANLIVRGDKIVLSHNPWLNPVKHEGDSCSIEMRITGLKDFYTRNVYVKDYLDLLTEESIKNEFKRRTNNELEPVLENIKFVAFMDVSFANIKTLEYIEIPVDCYLMNSAFSRCSNLSKVVFVGERNRYSRIIIGENAFASCTKLENFDFDYVTLRKGCFSRCTGLKEIDLSNICGAFILEEEVFSRCKSLSKVVFPQHLETISREAFYATAIEEINFPDSLTTIETDAFGFCKNIEKLIIPSKVITIKHKAFANCQNLKEVQFLNSDLSGLEENIFDKCFAIEKITFNNTIDELLNVSRFHKDGLFSWFLGKHANPVTIVGLDKTIIAKSNLGDDEESDAAFFNMIDQE